MQRLPEPQQAKRGRLIAAGLAAAGFGLTLLIFYPGIMTYDAKFVYEDIAKHTLGDWQSPVMTVLWALIDPIAPGSASMFLLTAAAYWLAFGVLGFTLAGRSAGLGALPPILALLPPAFVLVGVLWRDVLFAVTWLLAVVLTFAVTDRPPRVRVADPNPRLRALLSWRSASAELNYRRTAACHLHRLAVADAMEAYGHSVRPRDCRLLWTCAARLLRRAGSDTAASPAVDHDL